MAKAFRAVGLDFLESAPRRSTVQVHLNHPPAAVFAALAEDPAGWGEWFPGFSKTGRYLTPGPHGVGSQREVKAGAGPITETVLAWDEPSRWVFRIDRATMPGIRALAEDYRIEPAGDGQSSLTWTIAIETAPAAKPVGAVMGALAGSMFRKAGKKLDSYLSAK